MRMDGWPIALAVGEPNRYPPAMPAHLRRFNEPGHVHFWTISCYRRLGFFHHDGMKRTVIAALKRLQAKFESPTAKAMGHPTDGLGGRIGGQGVRLLQSGPVAYDSSSTFATPRSTTTAYVYRPIHIDEPVLTVVSSRPTGP